MFTSTILALATSLLVAVPAQPAAIVSTDPSADVIVDFSAHALFLNLGFFEISVKNYGPDAVESATVVLNVGTRFSLSRPENCTADTVAGTITCPFGPLPAGRTAKVDPSVYLLDVRPGTGNFTATATKTAGAPADPFPANDSVTKSCSYLYQPMPPSAPLWLLGCTPASI